MICKRERHSAETLLQKGIEQTREYMQRCGATQGHLVIFDADPAKSWDEKVATQSLADGLTLWRV